MTAALPLVGSEPVDALEVEKARHRLAVGGGGYEIIHESPGLEVGVYVLVAPEPDHQNAHADDELYLVLEGRGLLTIEGEAVSLTEGQAAFVPAGAEHQFTGYEGLSVLVIFSRQKVRTPLEERRAKPHPV
jgi:mannose-6-phosphate isomerase-like protein (cupin superfamily)